MSIKLYLRQVAFLGVPLATIAVFVLYISGNPYYHRLTSGLQTSLRPAISKFNEHMNTRSEIKQRLHSPVTYTINPANTCRENGQPIPINILCLVCTAAKNVEFRSAIRKTWGQELITQARGRVVFVVGRAQTPALEATIRNESLANFDIIQGNFADTYDNLTLKTVASLGWACEYCSQARFVVKIDDDVFLNVPNLVRAIQSRARNAMYGKLKSKDEVIRNSSSKWFVSKKEYPQKYFPDFLSGSAYVVGGDILKQLYDVTGRLPPFRLEDVYVTGLCAEVAQIARVNVPGFNNYRVKSVCEIRRQVTSHYESAKSIRFLWQEVKNNDFTC